MLNICWRRKHIISSYAFYVWNILAFHTQFLSTMTSKKSCDFRCLWAVIQLFLVIIIQVNSLILAIIFWSLAFNKKVHKFFKVHIKIKTFTNNRINGMFHYYWRYLIFAIYSSPHRKLASAHPVTYVVFLNGQIF